MSEVREAKTIKDWTEDERPREKMQHKGASALTDAELLGILISSGTVNRSAVDLARDVLKLADHNLKQLGRLSIAELKKVKGIGEARAITLAAAMELGRRRQMSEGLERTFISCSADAAIIVSPMLEDLNHEAFCVLYLNHARKLIKHDVLSNGGQTSTVVDIRMILKECLLSNATQLIIAHNHPSGNKKPSEADKQLTMRLKDSAALMDIRLVDHLIVAGHEYLSMADEGYF